MATAVKSNVRAIGWTNDNSRVALKFEGEDGTPLTIELPVDGLQALGLLTAQLADLTAERTGSAPYRPHAMPVWKWEAGAAAEDNIVVLLLRLPGGGAYCFRFDRKFAFELQDGIREAIGILPDATHKPN